jgi:glucokinase
LDVVPVGRNRLAQLIRNAMLTLDISAPTPTTRPVGDGAAVFAPRALTESIPTRRRRSVSVGLDIGGTKTDAVALDAEGSLVERLRMPTGQGCEGVVRTILAAVRGLAHRMGDSVGVGSVGIGIPGLVDPDTGQVMHAVNLGVGELDLAAVIRSELGVPVRVENDVKAAALGAGALRQGDPHREHAELMAYLNLGTGVAAGIVRGGEIWRGERGIAGEVGHISIDREGPPCQCGQRGCIETFAGGGAIAQRWGRAGALPVLDVFDCADAGDPFARELCGDLARGVAAAVRVLVMALDVDVVVLGGGVTAIGERLRGSIVAELDASAVNSPFLRSLRLSERVELLPAGSRAAALGAALIGRTAS